MQRWTLEQILSVDKNEARIMVLRQWGIFTFRREITDVPRDILQFHSEKMDSHNFSEPYLMQMHGYTVEFFVDDAQFLDEALQTWDESDSLSGLLTSDKDLLQRLSRCSKEALTEYVIPQAMARFAMAEPWAEEYQALMGEEPTQGVQRRISEVLLEASENIALSRLIDLIKARENEHFLQDEAIRLSQRYQQLLPKELTDAEELEIDCIDTIAKKNPILEDLMGQIDEELDTGQDA